MKWNPHDYQKKALDFLYNNYESAALLEPGLGKTSIFLELIRILKGESNSSFRGTLIIVPLRPMFLVWPKEMRKWENFRGLSYTILHGKEKDENFKKERDVYLINPEGLDWLLDRLYGMRRTQWPFNVLGVDESTKVKNPGSLRSRNVKAIAPKFDRRHLLTGTPAPRGLLDLFGQFLVMDGGKTFGTTVTSYRKKYFYKSGFQGHKYEPFTKGIEQIHKSMAVRALTMKAEDYLELPELIINRHYIELPKDARSQYNELEKKLRLDFKEGRVTVANAGILSLKCRQLASGGIYLDGIDEQRWKNVHDEKSKACFDLVEEIQGNQALLAYEFRHDLDRLQKTFGTSVPAIKSRMSMARTKQIEDRWNRGEIDLLFGQHTAVSLGLNLQESGNRLIIHTLPWSYETWYQLIRRLYRQGQKSKTVFVDVILAKNTVDEDVWESLQVHNGTHISLFEALKRRWE